MILTAETATLLVAVFIASLYVQRLFLRAAAQHTWDEHCAEAVQAADWATGETPTYTGLLAEERYLPLHDAIARVEARRLDAELFELLNGERDA